jgi:AraC-like DNA-binding protein
MPIVDVALRGGAVALLLFLAVLLLRDGYRVRVGWYAGLFVLNSVGFAVASAPEFSRATALWLVPFQIGMAGSPALLWPLAASIFDDEFEHSWRHGAGWLLLVVLSFACRIEQLPQANLIAAVCSLAFIGLAIQHALTGRSDDLVERRRQFRVVFVLTVGLYTGADIVTDLLLRGGPASPEVDLVRLVLLVVLTFVSGMALLGVTRDGTLLSLVPASPRPAPLDESRPSAPVPIDEPDPAMLAALRDLMERQRAYREEGLTIAALAARLGTPEYRLRRLINQRLEFRNFNEFLNRYRLADVTAALADPTQAEVPILTIALDAGFGSIGPFNRAFKAHTGQTPTEFRRERLGRIAPALASSEIALADSERGERDDPFSLRLMRRRTPVPPPI